MLGHALGQSFGRAPSDYRAEALDRFLQAWRVLVEQHPPHGHDPSFLSFLTEQEASRLSDMGKQQTLQKGQRLYARGDRAGTFGFVIQGALVMTEMQDLRVRPHTQSATRPSTRAGTAPAPNASRVLHRGDTFGEIPLALDGQIVNGRREATLHASDDDVEHIVFVIDYKKFATFAQDLPMSRDASLAVASRLLPRVLPKSQTHSPWSVKTRTRDNISVAASEQGSPNRKRGRVLDAPPVTMINMDVLLECAWTAKREEGLVADTTRALVKNENKMPHTVVFRDGEMIQWYFGWMSSLKRRGKEHLSNWQLLEDFCKNTEAGQIVAVMTCCKRGRTPGKEHAQCRLLDRRKLETILSGARSNRLTGCIQKYQRTEALANATEYVLQCCWANNSFTVDWVPETMAECFTLVHRPARMDPGGLKKLHEKMSVKYNQYVPGAMSELGDYFNSQVVKINPLEQLDGRSKARARQFNDGTDAKAGNIVERDIRDTVKTASQQIAATFDKVINKSEAARQKAIDEATAFGMHHSPAFTLLRSMTCLFKISKDGCPSLIHCTAAIAHPETKQPLTAMARAELLDPNEETFLYFAGYGAEHSRLSGLGERALLLDFSEFLQLLTKRDLLYSHISVTEASICFKHACSAVSAEEGQLKYPEYCECMHALRERMGLDEQGNPKYQVPNCPVCTDASFVTLTHSVHQCLAL